MATDNHNGVITDLEPDILQCEVQWNLESITMKKASGRDGIPDELFQILKDDAVKVGMTEDEIVAWHHQHGFGWTPGVGDGQGGLACCSSWGHKESNTTERLN